MKHLRKLAVLAVALIAVLALSVVAWADEGLDITDNNDNTFTIEFTKEIKALGSTGTLYSPQVTYTYSVDDELNGQALEAAVNPVAPSISVGSVTFNGTPGTSNSKFTATGLITATIDNTTTHNAFIYKIDEADPGKTALGIREEGTSSSVTYNNSRYLILVVGDPNLSDSVDETKVLTAYLYKENNDEQDPELKTSGWTVNESTYDKYETTTVTIKKEIIGKYADPNVAFAFSVNVNCSNGGKVTYDNSTSGTAMGTAYEKGLANNGTITITGVPAFAGAKVEIAEQNNTTSTYKLTTSGLDTNISTPPKSMGPNDTYMGTRSINSMDLVQIIYTNELPDISATGLALRVAPYAIVVGAGAALVWVSRRRREESVN